MNGETMEVVIPCFVCHQNKTVVVGVDDYKAWQSGTFVQTAFPYLSPAERELFISKTCGDCFDKLFPPEEE